MLSLYIQADIVGCLQAVGTPLRVARYRLAVLHLRLVPQTTSLVRNVDECIQCARDRT